MRFPSVVVERCDILPYLDWRPSFQRRMGPMRVIEVLEVRQFPFQVGHGPEQHPIQAFSSQCADQPFDKRMGQRHVRDTLDFDHPQDPKVGVPLVEPVQRIVVVAEARRTRLPSNRVVEHAAQGAAIHDSSMDAEADDPSCALVHDHQHPMTSQARMTQA